MEKWQSVAEVGGDQIHLVPKFSDVGGDAFLGSHSMVAPDSAELAYALLASKQVCGQLNGHQ